MSRFIWKEYNYFNWNTSYSKNKQEQFALLIKLLEVNLTKNKNKIIINKMQNIQINLKGIISAITSLVKT